MEKIKKERENEKSKLDNESIQSKLDALKNKFK
jgi:hypothetical protein